MTPRMFAVASVLFAMSACRPGETRVEPAPASAVAATSRPGGSPSAATSASAATSTAPAPSAVDAGAACKDIAVLDMNRESDGPCRFDCSTVSIDGCDWTLPSWLGLTLDAVKGRPGDTIPFVVKIENRDSTPHDLTIIDDPIAWVVDVLGRDGKIADELPSKETDGCSRYFPDMAARITLGAHASVAVPLKVSATMKEEVSCREAYEPEVPLVRKPWHLLRSARPMRAGHYRLRVHVPFSRPDADAGRAEVVLDADLLIARWKPIPIGLPSV